MYNILWYLIGLNPGTLASFYRHQKTPKNVVIFASSSNSIINDEVSNTVVSNAKCLARSCGHKFFIMYNSKIQ